MIEDSGMNKTLSLTRTPLRPTGLARRRQLLAEYARSGLSIAAFAREQGICYQTFYAWVARSGATPKVCFAEVELEASSVAESIVIELGRHARVRLTCADQVALTARLLKELEATC